MLFLSKSAQRLSRLAAAGGLGLFLGLAGCANPGQPRPPSLRLPEKVQKLSAERVGNHVILTWTTPEKTTDKEPIRGPVTAVICRDVPGLKAGAQSAGCNPVQRAAVQPGVSHTESVPLEMTGAGPTLLTYRVEVQNAHGHSAGPSEPAFVAGGEAPPPTGPLSITGRREGAQIAWAKTGSAAPVRLVRTQLAPVPQPRHAEQGPGEKKAQPMNLAASHSQAAVVELKAPDHLDADAGGVIDRTAQDKYTYSYTAERVATVVLSGHTLEMHSGVSPAATFTYRDIFPPDAPAGLVSVPGGGFGQAQSIDLSWDANVETGVLGYNVYRKDPAGGDFVRLNAEPVPASAFRDMTAEPGHAYAYRVTAVDQQHNESAPSGEIHETLRR